MTNPGGGWSAVLIVVLGVLAYHNSFSVPFLFDDMPSIVDNPTLQPDAGLGASLSPPRGRGITVEGRPALNVSLAFNYALGGPSVRGFHVTNLAIHLGAALAFFGVVRRTLRQPKLAPRFGSVATPLALVAAVAWELHPLQTESITYVVQRAESLMGLLCLLVLYSFIRGAEGVSRVRWFALAVVLCAIGMATKEVMVTAPIIVFLYDRTFVSGGFAAAWRRNRGLYAGLAGTWIVLALLVVGAGNRGGTIGASAGVTPWEYALCQSRAIVHYLQLAVWPHPLIFDYGDDFVSLGQVAGYALVDVALAGLTLFGLWRGSAHAFLGAWFFLILAPTSSFVGGTRQMLAEHRMYLPLAAVVVLAMLGGYRVLAWRGLVVAAALVFALGWATERRNFDYRSELAIYTDTAAKRPQNAHARYNLGKVLAENGRLAEAIVEDEAALRLRPTLAGAENNLGKALYDLGRSGEAIAHYEKALQLQPEYARAHYNLGLALIAVGRKADARPHFAEATRLNPSDVEARDNWGSVLLELGELTSAEEQFRRVLALNPDLAEARTNLGTTLLLQQKFAAAADQFELALRLNPGLSVARERLELARKGATQNPR